MRPVLLLVALVSGLARPSAAAAPATSSAGRFRYQPERIVVGTVYHYTKSNIDGSKPVTLSIYVASRERLEVLKVEKGLGDAAFVTARMDWSVFSAVELDAGVVVADGSYQPRVSTRLVLPEASFHTSFGDRKGVTTVGHLPVHIYNFDFTSLNFSLRHLVDPERAFEIGVVDPVFDPTSPDLLVYRGKALFEFGENTTRHGVACRRYRVSGPGLAGTEGSIWVNRKDGYIEDLEIPLADNPDWKDFKLELKSIEKMEPAAWKSFVASAVFRAEARD